MLARFLKVPPQKAGASTLPDWDSEQEGRAGDKSDPHGKGGGGSRERRW